MGETGGVMPQAAPVPPPAAPAPAKPKGAIGIWIGILLIIGGIVLGIALVVAGARSLLSGFDDLQRVPIDGGGVVRIDEAGTQTIYAERPSSQGGSSFSTNTFSGFGPSIAVRVIGPGGDDITVNSGGSTETYTYNGREGVKIGSFYAPVEGTYRIVTRNQDSTTTGGSWSTIAVGDALELSGIGAILGGVFGGGLVVVIGLIVVIIFAVRRSRSKKRITQASAPYPGAYGAAGAGWPAAPGYAPPAGPGGGWVPPPAAQPGPQGPGPTWAPPPAPAPQAPPAGPTWQPPAPAAPPSWPPRNPDPAPTWQPPADAPPPADPPAADPLAPPWEPPASGDTPPPGGSSS